MSRRMLVAAAGAILVVASATQADARVRRSTRMIDPPMRAVQVLPCPEGTMFDGRCANPYLGAAGRQAAIVGTQPYLSAVAPPTVLPSQDRTYPNIHYH